MHRRSTAAGSPPRRSQSDGLADQAAARRDLSIGLAADRHLAYLMRQRTMDGPTSLHRQRAAVPLNHERKDRGSGELLVVGIISLRLELDAGEATATA